MGSTASPAVPTSSQAENGHGGRVPGNIRDLSVDALRFLAVLLMLVNHTRFSLVPGAGIAVTSYLTVTLFAVCLGMGTALSYRRDVYAAQDAVGMRDGWGAREMHPGRALWNGRVYGKHVVAGLIRAAMLLLGHMAVSATSSFVVDVLGFLAGVQVLVLLALPLAAAGRAVLAAVLMALEPLLHGFWNGRANAMDPQIFYSAFGNGPFSLHLWPRTGEWGNLLFGAADRTPGGGPYSVWGLAALAVFGMILVDNRLLRGLEQRLAPLVLLGAGFLTAVVGLAAAKLFEDHGTHVYDKMPQERVCEAVAILGVWAALRALIALTPAALWKPAAVIGSATLSLYIGHAAMLHSLREHFGFVRWAQISSGAAFGAAFILLWLVLPLLWHAVLSRLFAPAIAHLRASGKAYPARVLIALTRGPAEGAQEIAVAAAR